MVQPLQDSLVKLWWREVVPLAQERAAKQYSGVRSSWSFLQSSYPVPSGRYRDPSAATPDRRLQGDATDSVARPSCSSQSSAAFLGEQLRSQLSS